MSVQEAAFCDYEQHVFYDVLDGVCVCGLYRMQGGVMKRANSNPVYYFYDDDTTTTHAQSRPQATCNPSYTTP